MDDRAFHHAPDLTPEEVTAPQPRTMDGSLAIPRRPMFGRWPDNWRQGGFVPGSRSKWVDRETTQAPFDPRIV